MPLSLPNVLQEEYLALRPDAAQDQPQPPLTALCLSGGGIRSATFALGVIQGLAEQGVLNAFDYLSTVSGGGYIGAWLTAWKQRAKGLANVIPQLRRDAPAVPEGSPDPIQHLREYDDYLSPKLGMFSADTWTLVATVARNMFLNWLVFLPLLLAALMAPRLWLSLAKVELQSLDGRRAAGDALIYTDFPGPEAWKSRLLLAVAAFFFAVVIFNMLRYLPGVGGENHSETDFLRFCLLPLTLAAIAFMTNDSWFGPDLTRPSSIPQPNVIQYRILTPGLMAAAFAGWIAYLIFCGKSIRDRVRLFVPVSAAILMTGWIAGSLAWLLSAYFFPAAVWSLYMAAGAPLLLAALLLSGCLFVGFTSRVLQDTDREWFARFGAWVALAAVLWAGVNALVLILPKLVFTLPVWGRSALAAAGAAAGWIAALTGALSRTNSNQQSKGSGGAPPQSPLMSLAMKLAAPVFVVALLVGLAILTDWILGVSRLGDLYEWFPAMRFPVYLSCPCAWWQHEAILEGTRWKANLALVLAFLAFGWLMARFININKFSLQAMYRSRLIRAYLGASNPSRNANAFTGFAQSDNILLHKLDPNLKPLHVINVTLNLVAGQRLAWQQRKAESFTMTPLHCGSSYLGYRRSLHYGGPDGISLGTAIAISGAAASPNMGYHSSPVIAFIMTLFNARLGSWLGNPGRAGAKTWRQEGPTSAIASIVREAFGLTNDTSQYAYLSDGGHFENLGIYEMVRRRCRYIVVSDGGCDPDFTCEDLGNALRKIRIDMRIPIDFEGGSFQSLGEKSTRCAIARIRYSLVDDTKEDGYLLYIKPMMRGNEPPDVASYQSTHEEFPHQSTADQFFDESQTESYRMLGLHTVDEISAGWDKSGGLPCLFQHVSGVYFKDSGALPAKSGSAA